MKNSPDWVKREIDWVLEIGNLSADDRKFLRKIAKQPGLGRLTHKEIIQLSQIQAKAGGES